MHQDLKPQVRAILQNPGLDTNSRLEKVCTLLRSSIPYYDWVGFYFKNGNKAELILGPFAGTPTEHTIIPFGKGICGQVAESNQNFVVPDVSAQENYIACSLNVKSEIVIPLFKDGENIGQIDIDSESLDPFTEDDERFLEFVNREVAKIL